MLRPHAWRDGGRLSGGGPSDAGPPFARETSRAAWGSWGVAGRGRLPAERLLAFLVGEQAPPTLPLTRWRGPPQAARALLRC